jgi:hypothetical protein
MNPCRPTNLTVLSQDRHVRNHKRKYGNAGEAHEERDDYGPHGEFLSQASVHLSLVASTT